MSDFVFKNFNKEPSPQRIGTVQSSYSFLGLVPVNTTSFCRLKIIENVFISMKDEYQLLKLQCAIPHPSEWVYNSLVYKVTTGLLHLLDSIARFCDDYHRMQGVLPLQIIYFQNFVFHGDHLLKIQSYQRQLDALEFHGYNLYSLGNKLKHEIAWVGLLTNDTQKSLVDIFDNQRVGLIHEFLNGAIGLVENIISALLLLSVTEEARQSIL